MPPTALDVRGAIAQARRRGLRALDELTAKQVLSAYGVAVPRATRVHGEDQLDQALHCVAPPFVLKIISPDILHKSDVGGVKLGLTDRHAVAAAMRHMTERANRDGHRIDGFLIEETAPAGHEIVIGGIRDPSFGPVLMLGLGGIFVEVLRDVAFRICPVSCLDARELIGELRGAPILAGVRGGAVIDETVLINALMAVGGKDGLLLGLADEFTEIDINPLIVSSAGAIAVDARFILADNADHEC